MVHDEVEFCIFDNQTAEIQRSEYRFDIHLSIGKKHRMDPRGLMELNDAASSCEFYRDSRRLWLYETWVEDTYMAAFQESTRVDGTVVS